MESILFYSIVPLVVVGLLIPILPSKTNINIKIAAGLTALFLSLGVWGYEYFSGAVVSWVVILSPLDFARYFLLDRLSLGVTVVAIISGLLAMPLAKRISGNQTVYLSIILLGVGGTIILASTLNPFLIISSWGLVSVASYALASIAKDRDSLINSVKYAIMGAISFQFLVIAIFLIYSMFGTPYGGRLVDLGILLLIAAVGFKVGMPPFHMWLPDLYGYSEPLSVAPLSAIMKLGPIALLVRIMIEQPLVGIGTNALIAVLIAISVLAMTFGNITALVQKNIQRMMAYSSIAQVGYMLMAVTVIFASIFTRNTLSFYFSIAGLVIYFLVYSISKTGIFAFIRGMKFGRELSIDEVRGMATTNGRQSASFTILMLNLIGLPPLAGFWGKLLIFAAAANPSLSFFFIDGIPWFALIGIVNSVISVFYYMKIVRSIYSSDNSGSNTSTSVGINKGFKNINLVIFISAGAAIAIGLVVPLMLFL